MIRRLEKRIHIGLPDSPAVETMIQKWLPIRLKDGFGNEIVDSAIDYKSISTQLIGYSGSDIKSVCKEAAMIPLRKLFNHLETGDVTNMEREKVSSTHLMEAIKRIRPSCDPELQQKYDKWTQNFGST